MWGNLKVVPFLTAQTLRQTTDCPISKTRRAFERLRDRLLAVRADFRSLKREKAELWRARYAALRAARDSGWALEETAVLGSDGLLRARLFPHPCEGR